MTRTALVVTTLVITLGLYDLYAVAVGGVELSISRFMQNSAFEAPFVPFTIGFICGHIFGYMPPKKEETK